MKEGAGIDVLGPALAEALEACNCRVENIDAFVSLVMFALVPYPSAAWVPL